MRGMPKLLIDKTSSLSDVIHNLPTIVDIRVHHPDIDIDWIAIELDS
jgi:ADP-heptose:LPS heptosyltransferase